MVPCCVSELCIHHILPYLCTYLPTPTTDVSYHNLPMKQAVLLSEELKMDEVMAVEFLITAAEEVRARLLAHL